MTITRSTVELVTNRIREIAKVYYDPDERYQRVRSYLSNCVEARLIRDFTINGEGEGVIDVTIIPMQMAQVENFVVRSEP